MGIAGLLSQGTTLSYKEGNVTKEVAAVKTIPALGSEPEKVEVTHLKSQKKSYVKGIEDVENLEFSIVYQGDNFSDIHTLVKSGKSIDWIITFPDKMTATFSGEPYYKFEGVEVNQAIGFNLGIVVSEGPDMTPAPLSSK